MLTVPEEMITSGIKPRAQMRHDEATQNPIFLFQIKRRGKDNWSTEAVFYSREEGREWGLSRIYAWGKEHIGWRVFCVPAGGVLRHVLNEYDAKINPAHKATP